MQTQDLVTLVPWTFIIQIINLFIQVFLIKKFLFKPINDILEKRRNLADKEIKEAREAKTEADSLKEQYESSLTNAHAEAAQIVSDAQKEAQNKAKAKDEGGMSAAEKEAKVQKAKEAAAKKQGSLAAKANLVSDYNKKNDK